MAYNENNLNLKEYSTAHSVTELAVFYFKIQPQIKKTRLNHLLQIEHI